MFDPIYEVTFLSFFLRFFHGGTPVGGSFMWLVVSAQRPMRWIAGLSVVWQLDGYEYVFILSLSFILYKQAAQVPTVWLFDTSESEATISIPALTF